MPKHAFERIRADQVMAGIIVVPDDVAIGIAIEELSTVIECCTPEDLENQVKYIPI